ncbi:AraC family transcriptional regulator [Paenibacillus filicis]|uniref:AraC family transcriptional regulator n=1 Tax=Paenibacillus gyeongsangnamensis TaxID=3388067 RepID=A0ABT4QF18_9BACL|nr:AraC family transcriptional regulator [Paenibacillus filicis]MCZ8515346.1 AraC family transcriptional regulator [Paenibacillus filicis]
MLKLHSVHFDNYIPNWRNHIIVFNVLALIVDGKVRYTINDQTVIGEKGDLLFFPSGIPRVGENVEREHQKITVLFKNEDQDLRQLPFLKSIPYLKCKIRSFEYMKQRFERLFYETVGNGSFQQWIVNGIFQELVGISAREFELVEIAPSKLKLADKIQKFLLSHYRATINIEQIAALINRSPNHTISLFREVTGVSPIQYVHLLRMKEACNLLTNSDLTITEISNHLGYYDHSYFFRTFKKYTSMSPTEYRHFGSPAQIPFVNLI